MDKERVFKLISEVSVTRNHSHCQHSEDNTSEPAERLYKVSELITTTLITALILLVRAPCRYFIQNLAKCNAEDNSSHRNYYRHCIDSIIYEFHLVVVVGLIFKFDAQLQQATKLEVAEDCHGTPRYHIAHIIERRVVKCIHS